MTVAVEIHAGGFARRSFVRQVGDDGTTWLGDVLLEPGTDLRGLVVDSDGLPVAGARVEAVLPYDVGPDGEPRGGARLDRHGWAESGRDGRFEMLGIPVGNHVVRARAALRSWSFSEVVPLHQGHAVEALVLELADPEPERWILGRVVGPDGEPVSAGTILFGPPDQRIDFIFSRRGQGFAEGRFELGPLEPGSYRVQRRESDGFALIEIDGVPAGTHDLVLKVGAIQRLDVHVRDVDGAPILGAKVQAFRAQPDQELPPHLRNLEGALAMGATDESGTCRLASPEPRFTLLVEAPGYRAGQAGPFAGDAPPSDVQLELVRAPSIEGVVLAEGEPVAGATVALRRAEPDGAVRIPSEWSGSGSPFTVCSTITKWQQFDVRDEADARGRFALPIEPVAAAERGSVWYLHARLDGFASAFVGPLEIDPDVGIADLRLELGSGGAVEGEVRLPDELEAAGSVVWIADEHGESLGQLLGPDARFRIEHLHPGAWQACWLAPGVKGSPQIAGELPAPPAGRAPDFHVVAGETTYFVLDVNDRRPVTLEGQLTVQGAEQGTWSAKLYSLPAGLEHALARLPDGSLGLFDHVEPRVAWFDESFGSWTTRSLDEIAPPLDPDGRFLAALDRPGECWLTFADDDRGFPGLVLTEPLDLRPPATSWSATLPIATISGRYSASEPGGPVPHTLFHRVEGPGRRVVEVMFHVKPNGSFGPTLVCAGAGVVHPAHRDDRLGSVPDLATVLARTDLAPGESAVLEIP